MGIHIITHRIHSTDPRLKRHIVHDPRSREFPAEKASKIVSVNHKLADFLPLDQGDIGACTANAATGAVCTEPYLSKVNLPEADRNEQFALGLYHDETELHPNDGVYPPQDPGGCGLWIAKVLKNRGLIKSYRHAFGLEHALLALVNAPVIFGVDWYQDFFKPDHNGEVHIGGSVAGGHEICAYGIDAQGKFVLLVNSWGKSWGIGGFFKMSFDTLDQLLKNQGDCVQFVV